ncbi:hypothetical protein QP411_09285 [Pseudoglutamicibacter cumminsii]|uniref:hypothetical protein n=1 Tax=Pseudoglutamicibacter cumminsii TaxID=156979 RepID=UPI002554FA27|nr:hypothetical protein [Pseudoglutamicibacter cumminsii]MDK7084090.1 hypothetical protein [Pseudoglutamicibacter cumminsii]
MSTKKEAQMSTSGTEKTVPYTLSEYLHNLGLTPGQIDTLTNSPLFIFQDESLNTAGFVEYVGPQQHHGGVRLEIRWNNLDGIAARVELTESAEGYAAFTAEGLRELAKTITDFSWLLEAIAEPFERA